MKTTLRLSIVAVVSAVCGRAQTPPWSPAEREMRWQQDLKYFADKFSTGGYAVDFQRGISTRGQKDFAKLYPKTSFDAALESLRADISRVSDAEMVLGLMRIVASANVAHNIVYMPGIGMGFLSRLPLTFNWYADDLAVTSASSNYVAALGARVLRIGTMTPKELLSATAPYISHENDIWLRANFSEFIRRRAVLQHFGLIGSDGRIAIELQKAGEAPFTLSVASADPRVPLLGFADGFHIPVPLAYTHPDRYYWYQYLADSGTFFLQYNRCQNDPKLPFREFVRQALVEADAHAPKRVVIDLRQNSGGNSRVIGPLVSGLSSRSQIRGHIYVLIGPWTFSSGLDAAVELHNTLHATLVGEPLGEKPNSYGEIKVLTLPNSKLNIQYTTKYFHMAKEGDPSSVEPDLPAPLTLDAVLAGRDPALEAAIAAK